MDTGYLVLGIRGLLAQSCLPTYHYYEAGESERLHLIQHHHFQKEEQEIEQSGHAGSHVGIGEEDAAEEAKTETGRVLGGSTCIVIKQVHEAHQ